MEEERETNGRAIHARKHHFGETSRAKQREMQIRFGRDHLVRQTLELGKPANKS